ncbi:MAG: hypothetical protein A2660_00230 [Candidatus Doudnabacteria bacterium RIFCSPHIGHO2_01_FULL_45_18]|uniref:STAS domain-containing protein n=1 Tax=Candidatus Doudnabacteria bacterium RIFCSPHIGHO2_01_FULL_45_18 TaxID=1817823 RepID=A0A1F5NSB8_9BACT|nr:MAG: hypothetical protein A2660_00230 [Candidatus Doudnabacteria bacterium RIFCSPHIGHO2_01_FULL_45_18]
MKVIRNAHPRGVVSLDLIGDCLSASDRHVLAAAIQRELDQAVTRIILRMNDLAQIDEAGVGYITVFSNTIRSANGSLALTGVDNVRVALKNAESRLDIFPDEAAALAHISAQTV